MSFLDGSPNLTGTRFAENDLQIARSVWRDVFARHLPNWPESPQGALADLWQASSTAAACNLIWIAQVLYKVSRALTVKSVAPFEGKLRELLRLDGAQFEELIAELEIAAGLSERVSPIAFEPLVPEAAFQHRKPYSPDYAIRLSDGDLLVEMTVLRIEAFKRWEAEALRLANDLQRRLDAVPLFRAVDLVLPVNYRFDATPRESLATIVRDIASTPEGERQVSSEGESGVVRWSVPARSTSSGQESVILGPYGITAIEGKLLSGISVSRTPKFTQPNAATDLVVTSLRNTLDYKLKKWGKVEAPYVLALKSGHPWVSPNGIKQVIAERILPNRLYRRLSGVLHYTSPEFSADGRPHELFLLTNDAAAHPVGARVWDLFEGKAQFHLP